MSATARPRMRAGSRAWGCLSVVVASALAAGLTGCATGAEGQSSDEALSVSATTGYLADAVANVAPDAKVTTMVGPGGDPHTYQPSTRDIETIRDADVVLWNGLHLEAQMLDLLESLGERQLAVGEQLPEELLLSWPETDGDGDPLFDPHIWNSPQLWAMVVELVASKLADIDPDGAHEYAGNAAAYIEQVEAAHAEAAELLDPLPADRRILITGHDAFAYFGDTFGLEVHATDFVSTEAALSPAELSGLATLIAEHEVPVIFQDNQANPQAITSLREAVLSLGWEVEISGDELFADSLGAEPPVDTYLGVVAHNSVAVADALGVP